MNNWYKISKNIIKKENRDYSWISISIPKSISEKTIKFSNSIPERELYIEETDKGKTIHGKNFKYGVEDDPHITVLWGIHTKNVDEIKEILEEQKGGTVKMGQVGMFEQEEYDVLKVNIISQALHRLNSILRENLKYTTSHNEYKPHLTLAYLKCGNGEKYIRNNKFKDLSFNFNEVIFEDYNDKSTTIKLKE